MVSVAGGAVLDPDNRARLRQAGTVVWLRADRQPWSSRVRGGAGRPLLAARPGAGPGRLDAERRPLYAEVADVIIDVDDLDADAVATACSTTVAVDRGSPIGGRSR